MTNQSTIDKLIEMRLTAMADAFRIQMDDPTMKEVPFEDRFGMLVDIEYSNRKNNWLKRLIQQAEFEQPDASIAAIDYQSGRKLNKALISRLATCEYITEYRNIFITGATPEVIKLIWPVLLAWRPANTTTQYGMCGFLIYYWTYRMPETAELFQLS